VIHDHHLVGDLEGLVDVVGDEADPAVAHGFMGFLLPTPAGTRVVPQTDFCAPGGCVFPEGPQA